jgi:hypothetical protein
MVWGVRALKATRQEHDATLDGTAPVASSNSHNHSAPSAEKKSPFSEDTDITIAEADVTKIAKAHQWDPNLPQEELKVLHDAFAMGDVEAIKKTEAIFAEDSPYAEVRAAVRPTDSGGPANTVRAWILGMLCVTICSGLNMFLSMRFVSANGDCA